MQAIHITLKAVFLGVFSIFFMGCVRTSVNSTTMPQTNTLSSEFKTATFAGGCFWCMEPSFEAKEGVIDAVVGFSGGKPEDASYKLVISGQTNHREAVQITFDPEKVSYAELLDIFWQQINPTDAGGQFADRGFQYTTAIYTHNDEQQRLAEASVKKLEDSGKFTEKIATKVEPYSNFFLASEYHQDFYKKSAEYYQRYKIGSGRADFISENWAKEAAIEYEDQKEAEKQKYEYTPEEIAEKLKDLDPLAYHVVAENGTERPFENAYWDNKADGIYVDVVTGKPLFSSTHKYDSGTGWPSFWRTIEDNTVTLHEDNKLSVTRTEIRSESGHLGHVFNDGPAHEGGRRFCTNSASLLFVPKAEMSEKGYENYLYLFEEA